MANPFDVDEFRREFREDYDFLREWREEAKEDLDFYLGKQWSSGDVAELEAKKRTWVTINKILPIVSLVVGFFLTNRLDEKLFPVDGAGDEVIAGILSELVKHHHNQLRWQKRNTFTDGVVTGMGWMEGLLRTDTNVFGDLTFDTASPFQMCFDSNTRSPLLTDCSRIFRSKYLSRFELKKHFPGQEKEVDGAISFIEANMADFAEDAYAPDAMSSTYKVYRVVERWKRTWAPRISLLDPNTGTVFPVENEEEALSIMNTSSVELIAIQTKSAGMDVDIMLGMEAISHGESPFRPEMFPFIPFFGEFYQRNIRGIVRDLKDPQREINKRRSEATNVIIAASKRGIVVSEGVDAQKLKDDWMGDIMPFIVLPKGVSWEVINPGPYPQGLAMAEQFASADIKEVSGVSPDLMGLQSPGGGRASGRAVALRQQQGITILATLID